MGEGSGAWRLGGAKPTDETGNATAPGLASVLESGPIGPSNHVVRIFRRAVIDACAEFRAL